MLKFKTRPKSQLVTFSHLSYSRNKSALLSPRSFQNLRASWERSCRGASRDVSTFAKLARFFPLRLSTKICNLIFLRQANSTKHLCISYSTWDAIMGKGLWVPPNPQMQALFRPRGERDLPIFVGGQSFKLPRKPRYSSHTSCSFAVHKRWTLIPPWP